MTTNFMAPVESIEHRFYHADRYGTLQEGQQLILNQDGLSRFGECYLQKLQSTPFDQQNAAEQREGLLDDIRRLPQLASFNYTSRFSSFFCANSIEEAEQFARSILPIPTHSVRIFEIFATRFWNRDSNWLDFDSSGEELIHNYFRYWNAALSNHAPLNGNRIPPRVEVAIDLPARVGRIVKVIDNIANSESDMTT